MRAVIFQPDRVLLFEQVKRHRDCIRGLVLDIGVGAFRRYTDLFPADQYWTLDNSIRCTPHVVADAHALPFKEATFDSLVCTQVLEHLWDPAQAISEFWRVLKTGGGILVTVPQTNELHEEPFDFYRFTQFGISRLLGQCQFDILILEQRGGFFATIGQQLIRYAIDRWRLTSSGWGRLMRLPASLLGRTMLKLDSWDSSPANKKHALGWCIIAKKR
jgi:SAM-dependent methyltransferase